MERNFKEMLKAQWNQKKFVSVGLDSDYDKVGKVLCKYGKTTSIGSVVFMFNQGIIDATMDLACVYKINTAFYEAHGSAGFEILHRTINYILDMAPNVPIILDAKRTDIGNTNRCYAQMAFDHLRADAITVNPYFGGKSLEPFLERKDKGIVILCQTSNEGADEFQGRMILDKLPDSTPVQRPLYQFVARRVAYFWNTNKNCLLVVGAPYPKELAEVRRIVGDMPILIPGVGAQQGDVKEVVSAGKDNSRQGIIVNASRSIIFASVNENDFADAARAETERLNNLINQYI